MAEQYTTLVQAKFCLQFCRQTLFIECMAVEAMPMRLIMSSWHLPEIDWTDPRYANSVASSSEWPQTGGQGVDSPAPRFWIFVFCQDVRRVATLLSQRLLRHHGGHPSFPVTPWQRVKVEHWLLGKKVCSRVDHTGSAVLHKQGNGTGRPATTSACAVCYFKTIFSLVALLSFKTMSVKH